jgi:hypothetical protein
MVCEIRAGFEPPDMKAPIWHYMRRQHAEDLFRTSNLRFKQVAEWEDQNEGRINQASRELFQLRDYEMQKIDGIPFQRQDAHFEMTEGSVRFTNYGSCWSYSPPESKDLWEILNLGPGDVALECQVGNLLNLVTKDFMYSNVGHIKYRSQKDAHYHFDASDYLYTKQDHFGAEREVRVIIDFEWEPNSPFAIADDEKNRFREVEIDLSLIKSVTTRSGEVISIS